jgi:hypothetical protein
MQSQVIQTLEEEFMTRRRLIAGVASLALTGAVIAPATAVAAELQSHSRADIQPQNRSEEQPRSGYGDVGIWYATWYSKVELPQPVWLTDFGAGSERQFAVDVTGEGLADAVAYDDGQWSIATSTGEAFAQPAVWLSGFGSGSATQLMADVTGDGLADAVAHFEGEMNGEGSEGHWYVAASNGTGFDPYGLWGSGLGSAAHTVLLGDVTGDSRADAVAVDPVTGEWTVAASDGDGFGEPSVWADGLGTGHAEFFLGDIDGDGADDAVAYTEGSWMYGRASGDGFGAPTGYSGGHGVGALTRLLTDGNGDGYAEPYAYFDADLGLPTADEKPGDLVAREYDRAARAISSGNTLVNSGLGAGATSVFLATATGDKYGWKNLIGFYAGEDGGTWKVQRYRQADSVSWNTWAGFPGKLPLAYQPRTLGAYQQYDSGNPEVIDEHIGMITDAEIDYLLLDETNNLNNVSGSILNRAASVAERLHVWNSESTTSPLRYAFAIGGVQWSNNPLTIEQEARQTWEEFANHPEYGDDYYTVDGKPLLVVYSNKANQSAWLNYTGDKSASDRFTVRFASSDPHATAGEYGWQLPQSGTLHDDEVMLAMPGWNNHIAGYIPVMRERGAYYREKVWDVILDRDTMPASVVINSFNEFAEDTSVQPADTSGLDSTSEKWVNEDGQLDPDMYWEMTVDYVAQYKALAMIANRVAPVISGAHDVGRTLSVSDGEWYESSGSSETSTFAYQWLRNGQPIAGATESTYQLASADEGQEVSARVTASRAGRTATADAAGISVRYQSSVQVTPESKIFKSSEGVTVTVLVTSSGADQPSGDVIVRVGERTHVGSLVDGAATVSVDEIPKGKYTVLARYEGDGATSPGQGAASVRVVP